jgi:hypothetical protein
MKQVTALASTWQLASGAIWPNESGGMASRTLTTKARRHKEFVSLVAWCLCGKVAFPKIKMLEEQARRGDRVSF